VRPPTRMRKRIFIPVLLVAFICVIGIGVWRTNTSAPYLYSACPSPAVNMNNWQIVKSGDVSFKLPKGFARVTDDFVGMHGPVLQFESGAKHITFNQGMYDYGIAEFWAKDAALEGVMNFLVCRARRASI
jgi:hypothetical protein